MHKIRIHGRGGQGAVTTGQILASAAFHDGLQSQTFPKFGVERAGAPVESYVRIDNKDIHDRSQIYTPDMVLILDPSLLAVKEAKVLEGIATDGLIIVNSNKKAEDLKIKGPYTVRSIDATGIAMEIFKRPIVNTPILGGFSAITRLITLTSLKKAITDKFKETKGEHIAELNKKAVEKVFYQIK